MHAYAPQRARRATAPPASGSRRERAHLVQLSAGAPAGLPRRATGTRPQAGATEFRRSRQQLAITPPAPPSRRTPRRTRGRGRACSGGRRAASRARLRVDAPTSPPGTAAGPARAGRLLGGAVGDGGTQGAAEAGAHAGAVPGAVVQQGGRGRRGRRRRGRRAERVGGARGRAWRRGRGRPCSRPARPATAAGERLGQTGTGRPLDRHVSAAKGGGRGRVEVEDPAGDGGVVVGRGVGRRGRRPVRRRLEQPAEHGVAGERRDRGLEVGDQRFGPRREAARAGGLRRSRRCPSTPPRGRRRRAPDRSRGCRRRARRAPRRRGGRRVPRRSRRSSSGFTAAVSSSCSS